MATADGAQVRFLPAASVREPVTGWDLDVLGGPIYSGRWHRDAHRLLKRHRTELASAPIGVFGSGPRRDDAEAWRRSRAQLDHALARHVWLVPAAVGLFGGAAPAGRPDRRDLRDWTDVATWTRKLLAAAVPLG